ncbi:MAG: hypothetical protein ACI9HK_002939 [Pirellulaceae bacterium]|jgi:hypothetical protein
MNQFPANLQSNSVQSNSRREFLKHTGAVAVGIAGLPLLESIAAAAPQPKQPETLVKVLYDTLDEKQKKQMCFAWDFVDPAKGLLRERLENNWKITNPSIKSNFYTREQQDIVRQIFLGITHPDWHDRFDQQLKDDVGGFGNNQAIAIFGEPGTDAFEFVLTSRHMTLRCDGNSAEHVAFGGPILYAHEGDALFEKPDHPNNVFWHQATEANKLYEMFDGKQRKMALVEKGMPSEELVAFRGKDGKFDGIPVTEMASDQKQHLQSVLKLLLDPFRQADQDEASKYLKQQGGLDACHLAFYQEGDLGNDQLWDNWRLEGPSFVWYFRGKPHVHVWVNVADTAAIKLNSSQNSVGV